MDDGNYRPPEKYISWEVANAQQEARERRQSFMSRKIAREKIGELPEMTRLQRVVFLHVTKLKISLWDLFHARRPLIERY